MDRVFITNANGEYIDLKLMKAEVLAFGENEDVDRVDPEVAEFNAIQNVYGEGGAGVGLL